MMAGINEYPLEYRRMIYKRIEAATGESAEKIEKAYFKKLEKILKRGVIKDREEYELVHSRIDELVHNTPEDDPARKVGGVFALFGPMGVLHRICGIYKNV